MFKVHNFSKNASIFHTFNVQNFSKKIANSMNIMIQIIYITLYVALAI